MFPISSPDQARIRGTRHVDSTVPQCFREPRRNLPSRWKRTSTDQDASFSLPCISLASNIEGLLRMNSSA
jgi:hypothetical protein